jgi:hypothetical protein
MHSQKYGQPRTWSFSAILKNMANPGLSRLSERFSKIWNLKNMANPGLSRLSKSQKYGQLWT